MLNIVNPKQSFDSNKGKGVSYSYYAGFSNSFATNIISSANLASDSIIFDPWNGCGTTTSAANNLGFDSIGLDINPVMSIIAKSNSMCRRQNSSIWPVTQDIIKKLRSIRKSSISKDPLNNWFDSKSSHYLRSLENIIFTLLVSPDIKNKKEVLANGNLSDIAALFYVILFKTVKQLTKKFATSNPTWIKKAKSKEELLSVSLEEIVSLFQNNSVSIATSIENNFNASSNNSVSQKILVGNSCSIPLSESSVDLILTSPPYCTRIDYAIATSPELAVIGFSAELEIESLRKNMLGATKTNLNSLVADEKWGVTCNKFLNSSYLHPSKASKSYYNRIHLQYFDGLFRSLSESLRVLKPGKLCAFVIQDSFYKEIHNDLPAILVEMMGELNATTISRVDFNSGAVMANINTLARSYRKHRTVTESVLCFYK